MNEDNYSSWFGSLLTPLTFLQLSSCSKDITDGKSGFGQHLKYAPKAEWLV